ncbi:protein DpdH [Aliterella atlantica]|uniref:Uncharacterized protein n=1 Tax=Aliterella atlantica CENA595 TaxID=1618023 RepID=A0A0D8ZVT5_9CYAN|nr:protein DpdH [Aliterella atlantica]KJH72502.1 hypothetical protein UH38_07015 [Aliterella atlantica CENA595]
MVFKNYVCWRYENVQRILNIEAIQPPDHIFLAIHHPIVMKRGELIAGEAKTTYTESEFLKDFLVPNDFAFVPILGSSGTGKSHLIRWLAANIESTDKRKVLLIPKLGTNLKDIIKIILDLPELQEDKFAEYHKRLNQAGSSLTEGEARKQLLNQLAVAVGDNGERDRNQLTEAQIYLVEELDSLLYDPFFRTHWLKDGGIIHRLITHILGNHKTVDIVEERREFTANDLPSNVLDIQKSGEKSRGFYTSLIYDDEIQKETVSWLNQHLDEAITQILNLGREDLQILMREVRQTLAEKDIELVLLIEDFAKLQGIDRELLEAFLARPQQAGSKPLCAIRTALACTTGYFESLKDTVKQRVTFSVNLDVGEIGEKSLLTEADLQQFVARYLNAVRQEDEEIQSWAKEYKNHVGNGIKPPSFCDGCEHRQACHVGFGEVDGMGLYPFTPQALKQMLRRVNPGDFKPRLLLKDVLKYVLENSIDNIQQGSFPSIILREHFGKMRLKAIVQDDIENLDPSNAERRQTLIDLWTDSDTLRDFPTEMHTAFNLPPLGVGVITTQITKREPSNPELLVSYQPELEPSKPQIPERLIKQLEILDNWNNHEFLPQDIEKPIREFVFPAVLERIEWDTQMLMKGSFAASTHLLFKQRNVLVYSPRVRGEGATYSGIRLDLPINPGDENEFRETAIAFQGILQYNYYKNWNFPDGDRYFRAYAKQLELWSEHIIDCIHRRPRQSAELWNPVPAAVELLAIAARMSGYPTNSIEDSINSLFLKLEDKDESERTKTWKKLFKEFQNNRDKLLEIVSSRIACTKGSNRTFQIIDAVQILNPLKEIRKTWQPQCEIPDDLNSEYEAIQQVRQKVDELLIQAIEEECDRQLNIYQDLSTEFGEDVNKKEVVSIVKQAIEKAQEAGVAGQVNTDRLLTVIDRFQQTRFKGYVETMKKVKAERDSPDNSVGKLLQYLSENNQKAMTDASEFLNETNDFLDKSNVRVQDNIIKLQSVEGISIENLLESIQNRFIELQTLLEEIR